MKDSDSSDEENKKKDYYKDYKSFKDDLTNLEKKILDDLAKYKTKLNSKDNTVGEENEIKRKLGNFNANLAELENAYNDRNAPSGFPANVLDSRQKELQQFRISYNEMLKQFNRYNEKKYSFKSSNQDEDYMHKEEFKDKNVEELLQEQKIKLEKQDDQLDEVLLDVKKNTVLAKHAGHVMREQNVQLEDIGEDMEIADERMKTLTGRFKNYANKQSWCCLVFILLIELGIALGAYYILVV